jgi:hypothetical protein
MWSIGVTTFGWRHKILKELATRKSKNVIETIVAAPPVFEYSCNNGDNTFSSLNILNDNTGAVHSQPQQVTCYAGGEFV